MKEKHNPFCITLINLALKEELDFKDRVSYPNKSSGITIRSVKKVSDVTYPDSVIHAIVLGRQGLLLLKTEDENILRSASESGTCRIYTLIQDAPLHSDINFRFDDFIQRTAQNSPESIIQEIISFFREADLLNRQSTLFALRDKLCLIAYKILRILWPASYIATAFLLLNAVSSFIGYRIDQSFLFFENLIKPLTFLGIFFIIHSIITISRNWLSGLHYTRKFGFEFVIGVLAYIMAIAVTAYSIWIIEQDLLVLCILLIMNIGLYSFYMYSRRIRAELTSISFLQTEMTEKSLQQKTLENIGNAPFSPSSFPLLPFRSKTLFISYMHSSVWSSETAEITHKWASEIGYRVFLDRSTIPSGTLWRKHLLKSLSQCTYFLAVIDGNAEATAWVLAESAYAALLRKNIGKPRILLLIKDAQKISQDKQNPFYLNYRDLFELPDSYFPGAAILSIDKETLLKGQFLHALGEIRAMSLINSFKAPSNILNQKPFPLKKAETGPSSNNIQLMDRAWKKSVLLYVLLSSDGLNPDSLNYLIEKCFEWLKSGIAEKEVVSLYTLNFLYKCNQLPDNRDKSGEVLNLLLTSEFSAVKLAALDFLSVTGNTKNLKSVLSETVLKQISEFRELIKQKKESQNDYSAKGVFVDIQKVKAGRNYETALKEVIAEVDRIHD